MKTTFFNEFIKGKTNIKVPRLQRDYVQGLNPGIKVSFCEGLFDSLENRNSLNLNFLYGLHDGDWFIPIDGQQRLTTLWILHFYILKRSNKSDKMCQLKYETREFSRLFTEALSKNLKKNDFSSESIDINDKSWFFDVWEKDDTVSGIIATLEYIHKKWQDKPVEFFDELWSLLSSEDCPLTFTFIDNREERLNEDIYLKMNSRGRTLSEYEKIKSSLDEVLPSDLKESWQSKIDNEWTSMIWENRIPVESEDEDDIDNIDPEQLRLLYNLIAFYWSQNNFKEDATTQSLIKPENLETVNDLLHFTHKNSDDKDEKKLMRNFYQDFLARIIVSENYAVPLYVIDKINLTPPGFFNDMSQWYDSLYRHHKKLEQVKDILGLTDKGVFYKYFLDSDHTYPDAVIGAAILIYINKVFNSCDGTNNQNVSFILKEKDDTNFKDWVRVIRNIVKNSTIDSITTYLGALNLINELSLALDPVYDYDIYKFLSQANLNSSFASEQTKEEKFKANLIVTAPKEGFQVKEEIHKMEDLDFFHGKILFPFYCLDINIRQDTFEDFPEFGKKYGEQFMKIYEVCKTSISDKSDVSTDFRRILFACGDHLFYQYYGSYSYSLELWKRKAIKDKSDFHKFKNEEHWMNYLKEAVLLICEYGSEPAAIDYLVNHKAYNEETPNWILRLIKEQNLIAKHCDKGHYFAVENEGNPDACCYLFNGYQRPKSKSECKKVK